MSKPESPYHYISSVEYIDRLTFDHMETYSFQRGKEYDDRAEEAIKLRDIKREQGRLSGEQQRRYDGLLNYPQENGFLLDTNGQFNQSSVRIGEFGNGAPEIERVVAILKTEAIDIPAWVCAPFYRDAIVFYDVVGNIISVLNICFSCKYMATKPFWRVDADVKTYNELRDFFLKIGHPVESK